MKNKLGICFIITFISLILIVAATLTFFHEERLENGILFTITLPYTEKDITYNFYNQNGKLEKIEQTELKTKNIFLEKTDYNSSKLLRKLIKDLKPKKESSKEVGITIYNGQNKRYYFLPFTNSVAKELMSYIKDGFVHSEYQNVTKEIIAKELYTYEYDSGFKNSMNGKDTFIIDTYTCKLATCFQIDLLENQENKIIFDEFYYYYNFKTKSKEQLNVSADLKITSAILETNEQNEIELKLKTLEKEIIYSLNEKKIIEK